MAKLVRIQKPGGGFALGRKGGKLITDAGGAPCCCGGGVITCGVPGPLCASLRGGVDVCGPGIDLGGRFRVDLRVKKYDLDWYTESRFNRRLGSGLPPIFEHWAEFEDGSADLIEPRTQTLTVSYCPETSNWIMCWAAGGGLAGQVNYRREFDSCYGGAFPSCVPPMDASSPNYTLQQGVFDVLNHAAAGGDGWDKPVPAPCKGQGVDARGYDSTYDSGAAWPAIGTEPNRVGRNFIASVGGVVTGYNNQCGTHPFVLSDDGGLDTVVLPRIPQVLTSDFFAQSPRSDPFYQESASVSGQVVVSESGTATSVLKNYKLDYDYTWSSHPPGSLDGQITVNTDATQHASIEAEIEWTKLDACTGGASAVIFPPNIDPLTMQPRKQPGQCPGCGE